MEKIFIALGSNLNNPINQLNRAIKHFDSLSEIKIKKKSSFYKTKPVGFLEQPDFINAVIEIEYHKSANNLLKLLLEIESSFGRVRKEKNGPRILDLDILLFGECIINEENLTIPHPRMMERIFVLMPLAEIAPYIMINCIPIKQALNQLKIDGIVKVEI